MKNYDHREYAKAAFPSFRVVAHAKLLSFHKWLSSRLNKHRAASLLVVSVVSFIVVLAIDTLIGWNLAFKLFIRPDISDSESMRAWSSGMLSFLTIAGLPVAFLLWNWRDKNIRAQIENHRKDTNLKEFLEVQKQAAGLQNPELPQPAIETMQIASFHHLRSILRGSFGEDFREPSLELLLAGHRRAMDEANVGKWEKDQSMSECVANWKARLSYVSRERMTIISDELDAVFLVVNSLKNRSFDLMDLNGKALPSGTRLHFSSFIGCNLNNLIANNCWFSNSRLHCARLFSAEFESADFSNAQLQHCLFLNAHLSGARMYGADLRNADLSGAHLENTDFVTADLRGANLAGVSFDWRTKFSGAKVDENTVFEDHWDTISAKDQRQIRDEWLSRGMEFHA